MSYSLKGGNNMNKTENKLVHILFILWSLVAGIGILTITIWIINGIDNVVKTYYKIDELSIKVDLLESKNKEITNKICEAQFGKYNIGNYIIKDGNCRFW